MMDATDWKAIRQALLEFFAQLAGRPVDELTDLKTTCRLSLADWHALADRINRLPIIVRGELRIAPAEFDRARTVRDIEKLLHPRSIERASASVASRDRTTTTIESYDAVVRRGTPAAPSTTPAPVPPPGQAKYTVWYGTSRRPNNQHDPSKGNSSDRDTKIHYGSCSVYIPKSHKIGSIGSPWWKRLLTWTDDRLKLLRIQEIGERDFWNAVGAHLDSVEIDDRDALIYVHGYRVNFEDAALRAAQIGCDLSIKGAMAFFSWPSQGTLAGYPADEATIEANEDMISEFMLKFASQSHARAVHIIAHSMGNRGVLRAINSIAQQATRASGVPFGQIILAAADVDADTFRTLCAAYTQMSKRTTLYVSKRDLAVESSEWLHGFARVGLLPPVFVAPGLDTINVTNADLTALGHGYVASARAVLQDMHDLIVNGAPPGKRFGLREEKADDGTPYWLIAG